MSDSNPYAEQEQLLLDWQARLASKERDLSILQTHLISWGESLQRLAQVLGDLDALLRGEPMASSASGDRPQLRLVPPVEDPS